MIEQNLEKRFDQLLAEQPRPDYDTDAWLNEDETATFDVLVNMRRRQTVMWRWMAAAAVLIVAVVLTYPLLQPQEQSLPKQYRQPRPETIVAVMPKAQPAASAAQPTVPTAKPVARKTLAKAARQEQPQATPIATTTPVDSLAYLVARIEEELNRIGDSCYEANVEKLIRSDERLQRMVNRLILTGILREETAVAITEQQ